MAKNEQLSDVLGEFARTMLTDFPIQGILDHLVERIVDIMPITAAGVTLISPGNAPRYVAASNEAALRFELLQTELDDGPCLVSYMTGESVLIPNLRDAGQFPEFVSRALDAGLRAVFAFPLRHGDEQLGSLDLYRETTGPLNPQSQEDAQTLADVAAAYLLNAHARSDLRDAVDRSRSMALHDALTGLANRTLLLERLDHAVLRARRSGKMAGVLFLDLDRFKTVNDLHGHAIGDELLLAVAHRLTAALRSGDTLARMSGDEFVVLCEDINDPAEVDAIAARICAAVAGPFVLSGAVVATSVSVGIAFSGRGDQLSEQILREADAAMYQAKRGGGARHQIIDLREQHLADERAGLERDLTSAVAQGELRAHYQPIVETRDGRIVGVEALLRWDHPLRGLVMPALLIPVAEQSGLISDIGEWVLGQACADRHRWENSGQTDPVTMAVNVSAHQLMTSDFATTVAAALGETATNPELLTLEVTESVFVQDSERALIVLGQLKDLGVQLALDDFGTGYASLSYLKQFPIDIVKIDQAFIADLQVDPASKAIVAAVVELAHQLKMSVVAEGIETADQLRLLKSLGCDYCQGYYFARPMPADELDALIQQSNAAGAAALRLPAYAAQAGR